MKRISLGWILVWTLALIPIVLWANMRPLLPRISTVPMLATSIGQLDGITGVTLFALSLILSSRLKIYDYLFDGMNKAYVAHHIIGGTAFLILMSHPLMLAVPYMTISLRAAAMFLLPLSDWPVLFGVIGLLVMMFMIIITYYINLPYNLWRYTHKLLGVAFFFGALHFYVTKSDVMFYTPIKYYLYTLTILGLISYVYRSLLGRLLVRKTPYLVKALFQVSPDVVEIELVPVGETIEFSAGQFMFIHFGSGFSQEQHPFSISSSPSQRELRITVKSLGDYTRLLNRLRPGTKAYIEGPYGKFSNQHFKNRNQIWIAGGIGITPFLSMARTFYNLDYRVDLLYVVHDMAEAVFINELAFISHNNPNFKVYPYESVRYGRISADVIERMCNGVTDKEIFLCGPPPMMLSMRKQLKEKGVKNEHIHSEEFQIL